MVREACSKAFLALLIGDAEAEVEVIVNLSEQSLCLALSDEDYGLRSVDIPDIVTAKVSQ